MRSRCVRDDFEGKRVMKEARRQLLESAEKMSEPGWRKCFLTNVPDNRELLQIASEWLGPL